MTRLSFIKCSSVAFHVAAGTPSPPGYRGIHAANRDASASGPPDVTGDARKDCCSNDVPPVDAARKIAAGGILERPGARVRWRSRAPRPGLAPPIGARRVTGQAARAARMRAQLRMPLWEDVMA